MRAIVAVLMCITVLGVGFVGISTMSDNAGDAASTETQNDAKQLADNLFEGVSQPMGVAIVWGGIGAVIMIAVGILAVSGRRGR